MDHNEQRHRHDTSSSVSSDTAALVTSETSDVCKDKEPLWKVVLGYVLCGMAFMVICGWLFFGAYAINRIESRLERDERNNTIEKLSTIKARMIRDLWNLSALFPPKEETFKETALERIAELQKLLAVACNDQLMTAEDDLLNDTSLTSWTFTNAMYFFFTHVSTIGNSGLRLRSGLSKCMSSAFIIGGVPILVLVVCLIAVALDLNYMVPKRFCVVTWLAKIFSNGKKTKPAASPPSFICSKTPLNCRNALNKTRSASPLMVLLILAGYVPLFAVLVQNLAPGNLSYADAVYFSLTTLATVSSTDWRNVDDAVIVMIFATYTVIGISLLLWFILALGRFCAERNRKDAAQQTDELSADRANNADRAAQPVLAEPSQPTPVMAATEPNIYV